MALIKFGGGVVQMSGSIAGDTFSRNRYGNYVRARTKPVNPNTARQVAVRSAIATLTTRWSQTLTAVQRTAWNLYADSVNMTNRLGETVHLSGFNHYIRSNVTRETGPTVLVDDGPTVFELPAQDPTMAVTASEATQQLTVSFDNTMDWAVEDGAFLFLFQGRPQNAQRNFFGGPWRFLSYVGGVDPGGAVTPNVTVGGFAIAEAQRQWIYARISRADGRLGVPFRADVAVGA